MHLKTLARLMLAAAFILAAAVPPPTPEAQEQSPTGDDYAPGELIVGFRNTDSLHAFSTPEGARQVETLPGLEKINAALVKVPAGQETAYLKKIRQDPEVRFAEPNYYLHTTLIPNDPGYTDSGSYGPALVNAEKAWDITTGSQNVILAIIDSGLDTGTPNHIHRDFSGRMITGFDYVEGDTIPQDGRSHGTHVTGIAAATGNNSYGIAGINWKVRILPLRILDETGSGTVADLVSALDYATTHGAKVVNMSLGLSAAFPSYAMEMATFDAYNNGVALIASAGNNYGGSLDYPALYPWVLAVGSVDPDKATSYFSSMGPELDIMAPGNSIYSTYPDDMGSFGYKSGTSMAAPFVSGAAAMLAANPLFNTPDKIYYALTNNTEDLFISGFDEETGYGLMQIDQALKEDLSGFMPSLAVEYDMLSSDRCSSVPFNWIDATKGTWMFITGNEDHVNIPMPFDFTLGTTSYIDVDISSNGYLTFNPDNDMNWVNQRIPSLGTPNELIAPFWDDLNPSACTAPGCGIYNHVIGTAPNRILVIEWYRIPFSGSSEEVTFEALLYESSEEIRFQYLTMQGTPGSGESTTVGIEYTGGKDGVQVGYNQKGLIHDNLAIRFVRIYPPGKKRSYDPRCLKVEPASTSKENTYSLGQYCLQSPAGLIPSGKLVTANIAVFSRFYSLPKNRINLEKYADIFLKPSPMTPFDPQPSVCFTYNSTDVLKAGGHPENLYIATYDDTLGRWVPLPTSLNSSKQRLSAPVSHFSIFGVFATQSPVRLPVTGASIPTDIILSLGGVSGIVLVLALILNRRIKG